MTTTPRDTIMLRCVRSSCVITNPINGHTWFEADEFTIIVVIQTFDASLETFSDKWGKIVLTQDLALMG